MLEKLSKRFKFSTANFVVLLISFQYCLTAPVENMYDKFINDLNSKACVTPEQIKLPSNSSLAENSELFSSSLKICQNLDTANHVKEAQYLCSEIFDNLKVVLCPNSKGMFKPLNITFSKQVCKDIASLKNVSDKDKLLMHLKDSWSCDVLCDAEFEKACQVLHWSYQAKSNFEENENLNKDITGNSTQASIHGSDLQKSQEPSKAENFRKTAEVAPEQTKDAVQQLTGTLVLGTVKSNSLLDRVQDHANKLLPGHNLNIKTPIQITTKVAVNTALPGVEVNEAKNVSQDASPKALQEDVLSNNDLPGNGLAGNNAGLSEMEDPHDNEDIFPHNAEPDLESNKKTPQAPINTKLPSVPVNLQLPNTPDNVRVPNLPTNQLLPDPANDLPTSNAELPQINPNDGLIDPHDGEELGEEESPIINPKAPEPETTVRQTQDNKIEIPKQNEANVQTQAKQATTQNGSSTTKAAASTTKTASSKGSTKSSITGAEKKAVEVKSPPTGGVSAVSADGKKTTESGSPLPSLKEALSSVVPPLSDDLSPAPANIDNMEGEEDVHENPEDREPEYNGGYESAKNKAMNSERTNGMEVSKVNDGDVLIEQTGNDEFAPRSKYGPDDVPLIPVYPGQEDGHFFFYFLSMVLILMVGYLIFHNKQKIIALIVEGRHERRRRSHGAGYKKLDTK